MARDVVVPVKISDSGINIMKTTTVYDTLSLRPFKESVRKVTEAAQRSFAIGDGTFLKINQSPIYKVLPGTETETVPQWNMPLAFLDGSDTSAVLIDTRMFERANGQTVKAYEITNMITRAICEAEWVNNKDSYESVAANLAGTFAEWVVLGIRRSQKLDPATEAIYHLGALFYYWHRIVVHGSSGVEPEDVVVWFEKFATRKFSNITPQMVSVFLSKFEGNEENFSANVSLDDVMAYTNMMADNPSITLDTAGLIDLLLINSWMGQYDKEITAAAIEHPPLLAYMVFNAGTQTIYRRTLIGQAVETLNRRRLRTDAVVRWVKGAMDDYGFMTQ